MLYALMKLNFVENQRYTLKRS